VHDSQVLEQLVDEGDVELYADSAYQGEKCDAVLQEKGVKKQICARAYRNKPLSDNDKCGIERSRELGVAWNMCLALKATRWEASSVELSGLSAMRL